MQPLNVGVVTTSYPLTPDSTSGLFVWRLVISMPEWVRVTILTPASTSSVPKDASGSRVCVKAFRYAPRRWQRLAHQPGGIPAYLKAHPASLVLLPIFMISMFIACLRRAAQLDLFHANWSINGIVAGLAGCLTGTPVVTTLRGSDVNLCQRSRIFRFLLGVCLRLSDHAVVVSESLRSTVHSLYPEFPLNRLTVIENGIDESLLDIRHDPAPSPGNEPIRLTSIGNLTRNKGIDLTIRALARIADENWEFRIAGDGPEREDLRTLAASLQIESRVIFLGAISAAEVRQLLAHSDIFVHASQSEGRSNAIVEAMTAALPVVATNIQSSRELLGNDDYGLLFPVDDAAGLARHLQALIRDPTNRLRLGYLARAHVVQTLSSWKDAADRYIDLYRKVVPTTENRMPN